MKFVIATLSLLVLVFTMGGSIVVVAGVLTPKVLTASVYWTPRFEPPATPESLATTPRS